MQRDCIQNTTLSGLSRRNLLTTCLAFSWLAVMAVNYGDSPRKKKPGVTQASIIPSLQGAEVLEPVRALKEQIDEPRAATPEPTPLEFAISLLSRAKTNPRGTRLFRPLHSARTGPRGPGGRKSHPPEGAARATERVHGLDRALRRPRSDLCTGTR